MDLADAQIAAIVEWAVNDPRIGEVRLFGSRAKGTSRPESDVDLALTIIRNRSEDEVTIYHFAGEKWARQLTEILGLTADVERFDAASAPVVYAACQEASQLIYARSQPTDDP